MNKQNKLSGTRLALTNVSSSLRPMAKSQKLNYTKKQDYNKKYSDRKLYKLPKKQQFRTQKKKEKENISKWNFGFEVASSPQSNSDTKKV